MVAFERARPAQRGGARLPVAAVPGDAGFGDQGLGLLGGVGAEPRRAPGAGVVPARFAGEVVSAEPFHALHQFRGFGRAAFGEQRPDPSE